jgi:hypothetical protein
MKTREEIEYALYKRHFINNKKNKITKLSVGITLLIAFIIDILCGVIFEMKGYSLMTTNGTVVGIVTTIVIFNWLFLGFILKDNVNISRKKYDIEKKIIELRGKKAECRKKLEEKYKIIEPADEKDVNALEYQIICLEVKFKLFGGEITKEKEEKL